MREIWSAENKVRQERRLWVAIMKAQKDLGLDIPSESITAFEAAIDDIDLDSIAQREAVTRHDLKARIDEFCALAGYEHIHLGLTSRDITENIERYQQRETLELLRFKAVALLGLLEQLANDYSQTPLAARTHNVIAQLTSFGKRLATAGAELLAAIEAVDSLIKRMKLRGVMGAVGTQQDLVELFNGDLDKVALLQNTVARHLRFKEEEMLTSSGQIYPRSFDLEYVSCLHQLSSGPASLAVTLRLMAGHGHVAEGVSPGQVGSSAMPHKRNPRLCERISGLKTILSGHLAMAAELAGNQWNEGDVSCSVVRRVMLPDASYCCDAAIDTMFSVLSGLEVDKQSMIKELQEWTMQLLSTRILSHAVAAGMGREEAHAIISAHIHKSITPGQLAMALGNDRNFPLFATEVSGLLVEEFGEMGIRGHYVTDLGRHSKKWLKKFPKAKEYKPSRPI